MAQKTRLADPYIQGLKAAMFKAPNYTYFGAKTRLIDFVWENPAACIRLDSAVVTVLTAVTLEGQVRSSSTSSTRRAGQF